MADEQWHAIVADQDIYYAPENNPNPELWGRIEYHKGDLVSVGTVVASDAELAKKGKRRIALTIKPDFSIHKWEPKSEKLVNKTQKELDAEKEGK